jgi:hypothetical protein
MWGANLELGSIATAVVGLGALIVAIIRSNQSYKQYVLQGSAKRAEHFFTIRKRLYDDLSFRRICELLEGPVRMTISRRCDSQRKTRS